MLFTCAVLGLASAPAAITCMSAPTEQHAADEASDHGTASTNDAARAPNSTRESDNVELAGPRAERVAARRPRLRAETRVRVPRLFLRNCALLR
jgi:hypothetical protein